MLQFLQQHHATLTPSTQAEDMVKKFNDLNRAHELLQAQYSASLRASTSPTVPTQKDDAELVTPPPTNHTQSSSPTSSLLRSVQRPLMASRLMAQCNPESSSLFTDFLHRLPSRRRHNCSPCTARQMTSSSSDQPRLYLKQSPTTTTLASLIKWANHPSRLNGNKSLESMSTQLFQARHRIPKGDAPTFGAMAALWGLEPGYLTKLTDKALCHLIVTARLLTG